jgi:hypothetical protein
MSNSSTTGVISQRKFKGFTTEWRTSSTNEPITLPLSTGNSAIFNFTVHWGDNSSSVITSSTDEARIHTYAKPGLYIVEIIGTCEGWSFNNSGDKLKINKILNWGTVEVFSGFKYLEGGFYGCSNLRSISNGSILASGSGCLSFNHLFNMALINSIPADLFKYHTSVTRFSDTFRFCTSITSIPADLFKYNTAVSSSGFYETFSYCTSITSIPADLFKYNTLVSTSGFKSTFANCVSLTSIPVDLFKYATVTTTSGFEGTFTSCNALPNIPADLFKYNILVSTTGFKNTFATCTHLTTVPEQLFRYNINVSTNGFTLTFSNCSALKQNRWIFYEAGEETTRFLNRVSVFGDCFSRNTFTGIQGSAPELWSCSFGSATPVSTRCFGLSGNNLTSLDNYASVPSTWKN